MAEERGPRPGETRDAAAAAEPGTVSRLLLEIAQASEEEAAQAWREALRPGDQVGRYQIRREIGRGGFGAVYEAFDPELGRTVALKALKPGRTRRLFSEEWIRKEAEAVAKLDHPAIVTIHDVGTCPAGAYLVMELLQGETLAERIARGALPVDEAMRVAEQMAEGLAHAHSRGVLHRDLKPANVFVCADGRVKLLDFGLAHLLGTDGSSGAGTPAYMAPEQAAGSAVDERADVYAAAMVLGEMLTGKRPVERATPRGPSPEPPSSKTEPMWETGKAPHPEGASEAAPSLDGVPRPVARVVKAALSVNPEERPKDGGEWLAELRSARRGVERPRRVRRIAAFATAFVVLGLAVAGFATWRIWERQIPGGRPTVAVADFANETGDGELDGISGLLITSLEQGTQLRVLTRGRMLDILRQLGRPDVQRIDEQLAREVGTQARANALLLASIRKLGSAYVVEMRALDPLHDEYVFTAREQASAKEAIFSLVDRLAATTRKKLGVVAPDAPPVPPIATITTGNVKAWDLVFRSRQALDQGKLAEAYRLSLEAVQADPSFALAHYQAAIAGSWTEETKPEDERRLLEAAERFADRLPEKERLWLRAYRASLDQDWPEALRLRDQAAEAYPLDKEAVAMAGDVRFHQEEFAAAVPYFERALQLDPTYELVRNHLLASIPHLPNPGTQLDWLRQEASRVPDERAMAGRLRIIANGFLAAGSEADAVATFRRAVALDAGFWPPFGYAMYLANHGRAREAEEGLRQALSTLDPKRAGDAGRIRGAKLALTRVLLSQGRLADARSLASEPWCDVQTRAGVELEIAVLNGTAADVHRAIASIEELGVGEDPRFHIDATLLYLAQGEPSSTERHRRAAREHPQASGLMATEHLLVEMADAWAAGDLERAEVALRKAVAISPQARARLLTYQYLGLVQIARGDCAGAIASLERAREQRMSPGHTTVMVTVALPLAGCYERVGNLPAARDRVAELLQLWERADPEIPRLLAAKSMQSRLASAAPSGK
ncbi:MAG TPA: protein kinase [Anaeromyxobacteraceae bacterium]|nr:protein kinase [Anaeromyxobacteraceae bacterium]